MTPRPIRSRTLAGIDGIRHGFFTREGGVSTGQRASLNCGFGAKGDSRANVLENRARAMAMLGVRPDCLRTVHQTHSRVSVLADDSWVSDAPPRADAIVSRTSGIAVGILTADCVPVLLADGGAGVVAAAHAGWRGALDGILDSVVDMMTATGAERQRICAAIGPAISGSAYEVGPEFHELFLLSDSASAAYFSGGKGGDPLHFDLPGYVLYRLTAAGVTLVENTGLCTYRDESRFFSYRRATHRGEVEYGRLMSAIMVE